MPTDSISTTRSIRPSDLDARQRWFGLDALVTGANALGYLVLGSWLSKHLGVSPLTYRLIGSALLVFAIIVGFYAAASTHRAPRLAGWAIVTPNELVSAWRPLPHR